MDTTLYRAVDAELSGARAFADVQLFARYWRVGGGPGFNACLDHTVEQLRAAGFSQQDGAPARYWTEEEPLNRPAWNPLSGELRLVSPEKKTLHTYDQTPVMLCRNSFPADVTADVIAVGSGTNDADYRSVDVKGKLVFGRGEPRALFQEAVVERGAIGILSGFINRYNRPDRFPDAIHDGAIPYDPDRRSFGVMVSSRTAATLESFLRQGKRVRVRVIVKSAFVPGTLRTLVAEIPGTTESDERIVIVGHIDHYKPGANDNASGAATVAEIARTVAALIAQRAVPPPGRTLTFLWVDEYQGTTLWISRHPAAFNGAQAAFVLDMVGERTDLTGGPFRVERMPDPSAIWLRPPDEHTAWGAGEVHREDIRGHFLNDFYLSVCRARADAAGWVVHTNPWEGGSDHDLFLTAGRPAVLSWHFPDYFYHTSLDDVDKVSPDELKHVGVAVATAALTLASASDETALRVLQVVEAAAAARFDGEERNATAALQSARKDGRDVGRQYAEEQDILSAWARWYEEAIDSVARVPVARAGDALLHRIAEANARVRERLAAILKALETQRLGP